MGLIKQESIGSTLIELPLIDFPNETLAEFGMKSMHPDKFTEHQLDLHQGYVTTAAKQHRAALKDPIKSVDEYLEALTAQGLVITADRLKECTSLI